MARRLEEYMILVDAQGKLKRVGHLSVNTVPEARVVTGGHRNYGDCLQDSNLQLQYNRYLAGRPQLRCLLNNFYSCKYVTA